jgi:hypothetical protein
MAEAVAADGRVPIRARLVGACAVHRQRWGLARWLPDDRTVQQACGVRAGAP